MPPSTLNYWTQIGLVRPSLRRPQGHRVEQYWSVSDIVAVRAVRELRQAGATLQQVRKASSYLVKHGASLTTAHLYWDGTRVLAVDETEDLISTVDPPGQLVFLLAVLPVGRWRRETQAVARRITNLEHLRQRDVERAQTKAEAPSTRAAILPASNESA